MTAVLAGMLPASACAALAYAAALRVRLATLRSRLGEARRDTAHAAGVADRQTRAVDYLRARAAGWPPGEASQHADETALFRRLEREMGTTDV